MKAIIPVLMMALAAPALAQTVPPLSDEDIAFRLTPGAGVETRIDGDLNGDGQTDTVYIEGTEDKRTLNILMAYREETDMGHDPKGTVEFEVSQFAPATLKITDKGVLVVEDMTGGTTATTATYRYRYDAKAGRMRLIGLDATVYSRTNQHGYTEISWNLLTGDFVRETAELAQGEGDAAYADPVVKKSKRSTAPGYMEETPNPDDVLSE
ncbi:hypothetical protein ABAC460_21330 [Asticcacaulis sp. AC460]|uniref:hypothetical protein n=1 Tax=Asticcacaulis sp. AC460 TaxID=1282360 RepID=UPI0003C3CDFF|nr:hypothetical protein [Asticcacaulis sp. AC460]ESQ87115.1 hypothetical protein ABAC460_21330 [Asticcacaulis sp. AC460]